MNEIIRQCHKGIAYCYYHPDEVFKKRHLEEYFLKAWDLGMPKTTIEQGTTELLVIDMTIWEIAYALRDVVNVKDISP